MPDSDSGISACEDIKPPKYSKKRKLEEVEMPGPSKKSKHFSSENAAEDEGYETTDAKVKEEVMDYDDTYVEVPKKKRKKYSC